jgi:heptosyltransferase-2
VERFAAVAQYIGQTQGAAMVILGGPEDVPLAHTVCQHLNVPVLNTTGQLSLMHTAALLQHCRVLLCNDSGLMHMAVALGVPVVAMFGPTVEAFGFYPFQAQAQVLSTSLACRPCTTKGSRQCPQGHHDCMQQLTIAQVLQAVHHVWAGDAV